MRPAIEPIYASQIVEDARKHGVEVRPVDISYSYWDNTLEEISGKYHSLRLGFRNIRGMSESGAQKLKAAVDKGIKAIHGLRNAGVSQAALEKLADADAFRSIGLDRRWALWEVSALTDRPIGLFADLPPEAEMPVSLPKMTLVQHVFQDYASVSLSLKAHPVSFVRDRLSGFQIVPTKNLAEMTDHSPVKVAGLITCRQRPGTAKGVIFVTLEDETGFANVVIFAKVFEAFHKAVLNAHLLIVEGTLQREGEVIHIIAEACYNASGWLAESRVEKNNLLAKSRNMKMPGEKQVQTELFKSRDFK